MCGVLPHVIELVDYGVRQSTLVVCQDELTDLLAKQSVSAEREYDRLCCRVAPSWTPTATCSGFEWVVELLGT